MGQLGGNTGFAQEAVREVLLVVRPLLPHDLDGDGYLETFMPGQIDRGPGAAPYLPLYQASTVSLWLYLVGHGVSNLDGTRFALPAHSRALRRADQGPRGLTL
jgi:hypothetical protein